MGADFVRFTLIFVTREMIYISRRFKRREMKPQQNMVEILKLFSVLSLTIIMFFFLLFVRDSRRNVGAMRNSLLLIGKRYD